MGNHINTLSLLDVFPMLFRELDVLKKFSGLEPDGLMFIFILWSSVKFSEGTKSGGCFSRIGSEMRELDSMW